MQTDSFLLVLNFLGKGVFIYLAAYRAIKPAMKGREMKAMPARAMGSFSLSDILSVFLLGEK